MVIAYEMLTHPGSCPWAQNPWKLPIACMGTATAGVVVVSSMGVGVSSTMCSLTFGICILQLTRLHAPPALAVCLIPQIMEEPSWNYPFAVGSGCMILVGVYSVYRSVLLRRLRQPISSIG